MSTRGIDCPTILYVLGSFNGADGVTLTLVVAPLYAGYGMPGYAFPALAPVTGIVTLNRFRRFRWPYDTLLPPPETTPFETVSCDTGTASCVAASPSNVCRA